jgi:beta-mannanase
MIPANSSGQPQGNLAAGASGRYNGYFTKLADRLVARGESTAYLRLGWEFDGNWFPWQAQSPAAEAEYASYFRQIVTSMRSVPGAAFKFVWNPDASAFVSQGYSVTAAYPGNSYVNVIGLDLYDWYWGTPKTPQAAWKDTFLPQLSAAESFAQSQGKPIAFDEWSVVTTNLHGFGDDPYYINHIINWMKSPSHNVVYESYFNGNTPSAGSSPNLNLLGGNFPQSVSAFAAKLGSV